MAGPDEYEADFMASGDAIYREKHVSRVYAALMGIPAIALVVGGVALALTPEAGPAAAVPLFVASAFMGGASVYFAAMRIVVTATHVEVQYGTLGPRIPIESIESARIETLSAIERFAWGPKIEGARKWRYIPPGVTHGVRIEHTSGGKKRSSLIGSRDAATLLEAIERARAGAGVRVRVAEEVADSPGVEEQEAQEHPSDAEEEEREHGA